MVVQIFFFVLIVCQISAGRWANFDDASVQGEYQIETHIDKNGNINDFVQKKYKILNEQGRRFCRIYHFLF